MDEEFVYKLMPLVQALRAYHRYEVVGLENVPKEGPAILACTHSLATYDISLLMCEVLMQKGRFPRSLIDRLFYKIPGLSSFMEKTGSVLGTRDNAIALLNNGELLYVAPGGMRESLRPMTERYQILWDGRRGFVKMSIETGAPIILAACPKADDIYDVFPTFFTDWFYKSLKVPVFLARGLGLSPIPKPVKLRHFLSEPIKPPKQKDDPEEFKEQVISHHKKIVRRMRMLLADAIAYRDEPLKLLP